MRRIMMVFLILGLIAAPASAVTTFPGGTFVDDDDSIFESNIEAIAAAGVTKGCNAQRTSFCPQAPVTRGQMAAFLVRALKLTEQDPTIDFTDDNDSIFQNDIEKLATAGITKGCGARDANTFCPEDTVTRGQMAAFLSRAMKYPPITVPDRGETTTGINLDLSEAATTQGCVFADGAVCAVTITLSAGQPFYFDEGFFVAPWSKATSSEKSVFGSDAIRVDAVLNGTVLDVVEKPLTVSNDIAERIFTFQFPDSWAGTHHLDVRLVNQQIDLDMTIKATIVLTPPTSAASPVPHQSI